MAVMFEDTVFCLFIGILLLSVLIGYYIDKYKFKYATEGSVALLVGFGVTGLVYIAYWLVNKELLPKKLVQFNDWVFFQVGVAADCSGVLCW